eukprot:6173786-Pleurochrysis_carterae.AAC.1
MADLSHRDQLRDGATRCQPSRSRVEGRRSSTRAGGCTSEGGVSGGGRTPKLSLLERPFGHCHSCRLSFVRWHPARMSTSGTQHVDNGVGGCDASSNTLPQPLTVVIDCALSARQFQLVRRACDDRLDAIDAESSASFSDEDTLSTTQWKPLQWSAVSTDGCHGSAQSASDFAEGSPSGDRNDELSRRRTEDNDEDYTFIRRGPFEEEDLMGNSAHSAPTLTDARTAGAAHKDNSKSLTASADHRKENCVPGE